ncbi:MAG: ribonuclease III domain-containing protein [Clostridia bacterium]|nr:ribonuclease III domain-containing protein [Clostridia bacterium]
MSIQGTILSALNIERPSDPSQLPALSLAYIGDTVYDLYARTYLVETKDCPVHSLHVHASALVCAKGQAEAFFRVEPILSEAELSAFKRGRNSHSGTVPKNASVSDYRIATGFEALLGYLYLSGEDERLNVLMKYALGIEEKHE